MLQGARIAVVVPAYNEARNIEAVLRSVPSYVDRIVVVDDGSEDQTTKCAQRVGDARVVMARHRRNRGVGAAIATGYRIAFGEGSDVAAVMAADGQMDPDDLQALLQPVLEGKAEYAKGDRLSYPHAWRRMPLGRWVGNHLFSLFTRWVTGLRVRDSQCGYTALSRQAAQRLPIERLWRGYGYPNDLLGWMALVGGRVRDVVVRPIYRNRNRGLGVRHALIVVPYVLIRVLRRRIRATRIA